jgi:hypothetical protein
MHILHNFRNPWCPACIKCRTTQSNRPWKSCHIDHLLWNHGSSLTFARATLTDHFFMGEWSMQSTWSRWSASIADAHGGSLSGLVSDVSGRYEHEIVHGHAHVQTDQIDFCAYTHAQSEFADSPKQTAYTLFHRHRWDAIPPRNFFYCCTSP